MRLCTLKTADGSGRLVFSYEASFLPLDRDRIKDLEALRHIRMRVIQGCVM
jgi:hypothetical protein